MAKRLAKISRLIATAIHLSSCCIRLCAVKPDVSTPHSEKATNTRCALDQVIEELQLPHAMAVPIALPPDDPPYNVEALWVAVYLLLDEARQSALS